MKLFEVVEFEAVNSLEVEEAGVNAAGTFVEGVPVVLPGDLALVVLAGDFALDVFFARIGFSAGMVLAGIDRAGDIALIDDFDSGFLPSS